MKEIKVFFTALMFYTRIPCPKWVDHDPEYLNLSIRYFSLVGWLVGGVSGVFFLLGNWALNDTFGVLLSLVVSVMITGAFHEDGFADVCDGFGGGWTREKVLAIMKDSRVGTFAVVGLVLLLGCKVVLLKEVVNGYQVINIMLIYIVAHALSRFMAAIFIFTDAYVRDSENSKAKPVAGQTSFLNLIIAALWAFLPLGYLIYHTSSYLLLLMLPLLYLVKVYLGWYFRKWIGGYTGDCLGASQQVFEVLVYFTIAVVWKFT